MPLLRESRKSLLYTFLICQILLNVTFSNAAVIRRDKRQISTVNVTETKPFSAEVEAVEKTENKLGFWPEKGTDVIDSTTSDSGKDTTVKTVIKHSGDEWAEDEYDVDEEDGERLFTEATTRNNKTEETTTGTIKPSDKQNSDILSSTVSIRDLYEDDKTMTRTELVVTTGSRESVLTTDAGTTPATTIKTEIESTSQVKVDSISDAGTTSATTSKSEIESTSQVKVDSTGNAGTTSATTSKIEIDSTSQVKIDSTTFYRDDTTEYKRSRDDIPVSTIQPETTDVSKDSTPSGAQESLELISTTIVNSANIEKSTVDDRSHSEGTTLNPLPTMTSFSEAMTDHSVTAENKPQTSTKTFEDTTFVSKSKDDITTTSGTSKTDETTVMSTKEESKPLTSTFKSDDSTMMFLTSTETFDEDGAQTTFQASPLIQEPSASLDETNSTTTSAEKRGKFIDDNYSYLNELRQSNTSDAWALTGAKGGEKAKSSELQNSVETSDEKAINHSMVTKTLLDWSRVMMSTDAITLETTVKTPEFQDSSVIPMSTEMSATQEMSTLKPGATDAVTTTDKTDSTAVGENEVVTNIPDTTKNIIPTTFEQLSVDDTSLSQTDEALSTTITAVTTVLTEKNDANLKNNQVQVEDATTTTTPIPTTTKTPILSSATMKSETTNSPVNSEVTEEQKTGTILTSSVSSIDFTTPPTPFLTSPTITTTTTTTTVRTSTTPEIAFNMDVRTNETPNMATTLIPEQMTAMATTTTTTTTTSTQATTPAVTVMAATTDEIQKTEYEAHTPAIISNDTAQQNETNNNNSDEVASENPTTATNTKSADSSSREAFEASTRVEPNLAASTADTRTHTAEVNSLDDLDATTESNFESSNTYEVATPQTSTTTVGGGILKFVTDTHVIASVVTATATSSRSTTTEEDLEPIDSIQKISDRGETSIESNVIDPLQAGEASTTTTTTSTAPPPTPQPTATTTTTTTRTTEKSEDNMRMPSTDRGWVTEDSSSTTTTTTLAPTTPATSSRYDDTTTPLQSISTKNEDLYSIVPPIDNGGGFHVPKLIVDETTTTMSGVLAAGAGQPMDTSDGQETDVNVIIAISVSVVGIVALILLVAFLYVMRKRQKQMSYGQRCRPVSLDAYSLDNVSVYNSVRRKGAALRASKRSYGNVAFDDPSLRHNVLGTHELAKFVEKKSSIWDEFKDVPQIIARADEVPAGCEDKNRYANVIPLPETRVILQQQNGDEKTEYINANYVRGPKDSTNYYIACQAPLETTVIDFWRMIWEQNSRVIIMATDLIENGIDKCAEYLPPSVTLDNHTVFGDFQVTLKNREVKEKYAISTLMLKNTATDESREVTHYWYQWPEAGVPTDEAAVIAMLLEARSSLKAYTIEQSDTKIDTIITEENETSKKEINGNVASEKPKHPPKDQGPLTIHCSPGTGRTGTILACDIAMRCLEEPKRCVDIPQIVYSVRRGRASAVQTKEQYEFIYKVTHVYATKISNLNSDN